MKYKKCAALLTAAALLLPGCAGLSEKRNLTYTDILYDTTISVKILDPASQDVLDGCEELCRKYDTMFSATQEDGEIYQINHAQGAAVPVSAETIDLIKRGIYYGDLSNGAFDITIGAVSSLWDFKAETPQVPSSEALAQARTHVDYKKIVLKDNTVMLTDPGAALDVGAIAKGYIADRVKEYLEDQGVRHAVIDLGGNIQTIGTKPDGSSYNIAIQRPFAKNGEAVTSVKIENQSVVSTGIYQRYFETEDGTIYHHILDPATGAPCRNNLYSVTIITDSSLTADALSTTCFLLGYEESMNLIDQLENVDAVFITSDGALHYSSNFQKKQ